MVRLSMLMLSALWLLGISPVAAAAETLRFEQAGVELVGDLYLPAGECAAAAAVIIQGSGDSGRSNDWARLFATSLRDMGYAALLPDKRGSGESGGDWQTVGLDVLAEDAIAGANRIRAHPRVDAGRVGYLGLSQGGRVAPIAALADGRSRFAINVSGSMQVMYQQLYDELELAYRAHGLDDATITYLQKMAYTSIDYAESGSDEDWARYLALHREISAGPLAVATESWPDERDDPYWHFWSAVWDEDPVPAWLDLVSVRNVPALVLYGTGDRNVKVEASVEIAAALAEDTDFTVKLYEGGKHSLRDRSSHGGPRLRADTLADLELWLTGVIGAPAAPNLTCRQN